MVIGQSSNTIKSSNFLIGIETKLDKLHDTVDKLTWSRLGNCISETYILFCEKIKNIPMRKFPPILTANTLEKPSRKSYCMNIRSLLINILQLKSYISHFLALATLHTTAAANNA